MDAWTSDTWFGLVILIWVLLALPLMSRQATDLSMEERHPRIPNGRHSIKTNKLAWTWIGGLVLLLLGWGASR